MLKIITSIFLVSGYASFAYADGLKYNITSLKPFIQISDTADKKILATQLKCPENNSNIFEIIERDGERYLRRSRAKFIDTSISKVIIEVWKQGAGFEVTEVFDNQIRPNVQDKIRSEKTTERLFSAYRNYCGSYSNRLEAERLAKLNRDYLYDLNEGDLIKADGDVRRLIIATNKEFKPIGLKCPEGQNGQLILMKANDEGLFTSFYYGYFGGRPKQITGMGAYKAGEWQRIHRSYPDYKYGTGDGGQQAAEFIKPVYEIVCQSKEHTKRFFELTKKNRKKFISDVRNSPQFDKNLFEYE